ncbi:hypothetical protein BDB01DRAFT_720125 [Pilobolus umbonatus]|nr:hypothetical protein BDB01DRAFT_720125 [Pilobolus umbonatus]
MLLDDLSYKDTLDRLLNIRFQLIHDTIHSPIKGADHPTSRILHQVKDIIMVIRKTMIQANEIFTRNENESTLIESYVSSFQQTFSIPSSTTNGTEIPNQPAVTRLFSPTSDVHLVMRYLPEAILKYTPQFEPAPLLPHGEVKSMILAWLQKVKYYIHDQLPSMMDSLDTEGQLTKIKNKIWETLYEDENTVRGGNKWQTSMQLLLDQQYSIWNSMFREIFIEKEKQIIDLGFIKLMEQPKFIIEPLLLNYSQSPLKEHSEISVDVWPPVASTGYNLLTLPSSSSSKEIITFHHALSRIAHDQVDILIQFQSSFDTLLDKLKQDIDTYTIPYENNLFQCSFDSVTIKSYFEDKCFDAVMNYTSGLKGLLKKAVELTDETKVNDISIIIGRLAKNIATLSTQLPKTLKIDNDTSTVYALYSSIDKDPKYAIIQNELMDVFHEAHTPWLNYLNRVFSKSLESILWTHNWDDQCPSFLIWESELLLIFD